VLVIGGALAAGAALSRDSTITYANVFTATGSMSTPRIDDGSSG